jgi:hypothetical protein
VIAQAGHQRADAVTDLALPARTNFMPRLRRAVNGYLEQLLAQRRGVAIACQRCRILTLASRGGLPCLPSFLPALASLF